MAVKTYLEQLEEVQIAIGVIETTAQSYTMGTRSLTRADLGKLYMRERFLRSMANRENNSNKIIIQYGMPDS